VSDPRGLAPAGWHVPSKNEWTILEDYLGNDDGKKMKSTSGWNGYGCKRCDGGSQDFKNLCSACKGKQINSTESFDGNGTNASGFSGLPGGNRGYFFKNIGKYGSWWSSTKLDDTGVFVCGLGHDGDHCNSGRNGNYFGLSVRCLKD
jgi:uncharacterized protein (TIGR02145 family)